MHVYVHVYVHVYAHEYMCMLCVCVCVRVCAWLNYKEFVKRKSKVIREDGTKRNMLKGYEFLSFYLCGNV